MGHGIAQVLAMSGIETCLFDISEEAVADGLAKIAGNLDKGVARGKVSGEEKAAAVSRLSGAVDLERAIEGVQVVVEAVPERMGLKRDLFGRSVPRSARTCCLRRHLVALHHRDRRRHGAPRASGGHALLQPGTS